MVISSMDVRIPTVALHKMETVYIGAARIIIYLTRHILRLRIQWAIVCMTAIHRVHTRLIHPVIHNISTRSEVIPVEKSYARRYSSTNTLVRPEEIDGIKSLHSKHSKSKSQKRISLSWLII